MVEGKWLAAWVPFLTAVPFYVQEAFVQAKTHCQQCHFVGVAGQRAYLLYDFNTYE